MEDRAGAFTKGTGRVWEGVLATGYSTAQSQMGQGVRCQEDHYVEALPSWQNSKASPTSSEINGFHCVFQGVQGWGGGRGLSRYLLVVEEGGEERGVGAAG